MEHCADGDKSSTPALTDTLIIVPTCVSSVSVSKVNPMWILLIQNHGVVRCNSLVRLLVYMNTRIHFILLNYCPTTRMLKPWCAKIVYIYGETPARWGKSLAYSASICGSNTFLLGNITLNLKYKSHQIPTLKYFPPRLAFVFAQSIKIMC